MPLRRKIFASLALVVTLYAVLDQFTQRRIVLPSFERLEEEEAREDVQRVANAIQRELEVLESRAREWGRWDATWNFYEQRDDAFIAANLDPLGLTEAGLHLVFFCARDGTVLWSRIRDPETNEELSLRDFPREIIAPEHVLLTLGDGRGEVPSRRGVLTLLDSGRPLMVASHQVLRSDGSGPSRGTVILGRFLDSEATVKDLVAQTRVTFDIWDGTSANLPESEQGVLATVTTSLEPVTLAGDDGTLYAYTSIADIRNNHSLLLRANTERRISAQGRTALRYSFISTIAAGLILLLVLLGILQRTVVAPLLALAGHAVQVGKADDTLARLELDRTDEIGILSREFDSMLAKLHDSRQEVVTAARIAGMSEIATGVLHNVGNVLNSVNVSAELVTRKLRNDSVEDLARIVEVLDSHEADLATFISEDPQGKHLHPLLRSLSKKFAENRSAVESELKGLETGIGHIKVLIRAQQSYAKSTEVREPTDVAQLLEDTLKMSYQVRPR
jgi:sensor domain CHASE-containing protein